MLKIRCAFIPQFFVTIYKGKNRTFFSLEKKKKKEEKEHPIFRKSTLNMYPVDTKVLSACQTVKLKCLRM